MKLFVCEFITGGGLVESDLHSSLIIEGEMMLRSVLSDCLAGGDMEITTTRDSRLPALSVDIETHSIEALPWDVWRKLMQQCDYALLIAPETDNALFKLTSLAEQTDCLVLGCGSNVIAMTSSKRKCVAKLSEHGIVVPESIQINSIINNTDQKIIVKPDDGAGGEQVLLFNDASSFIEWRDRQEGTESIHAEYFVNGIAASLCLFCDDEAAHLLTVNQQQLEFKQGQCNFSGVIVNQFADRRAELMPLVTRIYQAFPDLRGFVGVDLVLTKAEPVVIEVNPRLTTAYSGIKDSLGYNPVSWFSTLIDKKECIVPQEKSCIPVAIVLDSH